ncbi:unnamed protein product [Camellia sinensis]
MLMYDLIPQLALKKNIVDSTTLTKMEKIKEKKTIRYFLSSSLLLVECGRIKILTNFCFCNPQKNQDENFWF